MRQALRQEARVRGRDGIEYLPPRALRLFPQRGEGVLLGGAKPGQEHELAFEHETIRDGTFDGGRGRDQRRGVRRLPAGDARPRAGERGRGGDGQPLRPQKREGEGADRGGGRGGALSAALLAGLQPDRGGVLEDQDLIRKAGARVHEALVAALGEAISAVSEEDARAFYEHCGYREAVQLL